ncbi:MAG: hypothetical protein ACRD8W_29590 [Nitrososphaeraceae archaeon]
MIRLPFSIILSLSKVLQGEQAEQGPTQILSVRQVEGNLVHVSSESVASCDSDEEIVGGGFRAIAADIIKNRAEGNSWVVGGTPSNPFAPNPQVQAYAECATLIS